MNDDMDTQQAQQAQQAQQVEQERQASQAPRLPVPAVPASAPRRRLLGAALPVVLVIGALGGGIGYVKLTVDAADRTAPTTVWKASGHRLGTDPAEKANEGRTDNDLSRQLLPVPPGYRLGPDAESGEFGNDVLLTAKQANALLRSRVDDLFGGAGLSGGKGVDQWGLKSVAERVYLADSNELLVEIGLTRVANPGTARTWYEIISHSYTGGRKGPTVKGHTDVTCELAPKDTKAGLDTMSCSAYKGDLTLQVNATGTKPFPSSDVAELVGEQLDHIASPGKSI